ncbi:MAG: PAS domain-containing protein [Alphaproteobacteria bacterium]|nr:PAS domain-containing protein [Alphaproteobacteria bacterium]
MPDWIDPSTESIEGAADLIVSGRWRDAFAHGVDDIAFVDESWLPQEKAHQDVLDFWKSQKARRSDSLFTSSMVDPTAIGKVLSKIMLLDVEEDGMDARYRVYGTGISSMVGKDWTGKLVSEMNRSVRSNQALFYRACYRAVFRTAKPMFTHHQPLSWIDASAWKRLILPVHDEFGNKVVRFLVCNLADKGRELSSHEWKLMHDQRYS